MDDDCSPNGGPCKMQTTIESIRLRTDRLEAQAGEDAAKARRFATQLERFDKHLSEFKERLSAFKTQQDETTSLMKRIIDSMEVGAIRPAKPRDEARSDAQGDSRVELPSFGDEDDLGEYTKNQSREALIVRTKTSEKTAARLSEKAEAERTYRMTVEEENAALRAVLVERESQAKRDSERVKALITAAETREEKLELRRWTRAQKIGAGILACITALGGGAGLFKLVSDLFVH